MALTTAAAIKAELDALGISVPSDMSFPYGFRILESEKAIRPLTKEEFERSAEAMLGRPLTEGDRGCVMDHLYACRNNGGCTKQCYPDQWGADRFCTCRDP